MGAVEYAIRLGVVVEAPHLPAVGVVAITAVLAQSLLMGIIRAMACRAVDGSISIGGRGVAGLAGCDRVQAHQRESRQVVVEEDLPVPPTLIVATLALLAFLAFVDVVRPMAAQAGTVEPFRVDVPVVRVLAGKLLVLSA